MNKRSVIQVLPVGMREAIEETLDSLWNDAETLGRVALKRGMFDGDYEAEIMFRNSSGSLIFAKGSDRDRNAALAKCINEARNLGA